jgi:3'-phosphoadenosine 5'-phosphosulfate sulfotransferase (PAPS reductase)/FAD synthetase
MYRKAVDAIKSVLTEGRTVIVAFSGGKDSSTLASLTLRAALELIRSGTRIAKIYITTSDTGIENPEIHNYMVGEHEKMNAYARENGIPLATFIATPDLLDTWSVKTMGKRSLPTFPDSRDRECAADGKVKPQKKLRNRLFAEITAATGKKPIVFLGTRYEESSARAARMTERGETDDAPWQDESGDMYMSPICRWSHDDVWCYLSDCTNGKEPSYSDFRETTRIYRDATGEG